MRSMLVLPVLCLAVVFISACDEDEMTAPSFEAATSDSVILSPSSDRYSGDATALLTVDNNSDETIQFLALCGIYAEVETNSAWEFLHRYDCSLLFEAPSALQPDGAKIVSLALPSDAFPAGGQLYNVRFLLPVLIDEGSSNSLQLVSTTVEVLVP